MLLCGHELGLGFVVGQQLLAAGHTVTMLTCYEDLVPNLTKNNITPIVGHVLDASVQQSIRRADAVIDVECPNPLLSRRVYVNRLRPFLLAQALEGTGRPLVVTTGAAVLGDTGPTPVSEDARLHPLRGHGWLARLENELLKSSKVQCVVIRPAWELHGCRPPSCGTAVSNWMRLARRFRRGRYIGSGENRWSAVHFDDLAELYPLALKKAASRTILHAVSENFSMKELVTTIHAGFGFKGEPSSLTLKDARRFSPIADALIQSHALSSEVARALGWQPFRGSIMKEVEQEARENAFVSRAKVRRTEQGRSS